MSAPAPELSIVIPAYNEERRLLWALIRVFHFLRDLGIEGEVIVVDDGSRDRTAELVRQLARNRASLRLLSNPGNRGKGYSVRHGMLESRGRIALFTDADLSAPIEEAPKLLDALAEYDVAIGSRALDRSLITHRQPRWRELAGIAFNRALRLITGLPFEDTQCGFKAFRMDRARILFEQQTVEGFGFDPEILFLARRHGLRTVEIPVRWAHDPDSRVAVLADGMKMLGDVLRVRWNALRGRYPRRPRDSR
jgi:glycosyltransferase involved in cell wall biosynthesis